MLESQEIRRLVAFLFEECQIKLLENWPKEEPIFKNLKKEYTKY